MLDGGQQKWEAIEQVIRMDQSAVVVRLPESSTEIAYFVPLGDLCTDFDQCQQRHSWQHERSESSEKDVLDDIADRLAPTESIAEHHSHFPSLSDLWSALAVSGPR